MTQYRFLFADLLTNQVIGELPLTGVSATQQINSIGSFRGTLLLSGVDADKLNVEAATIPGRTAIYVDRDGVLVWGGILWGRHYASDTQTIEFQAQEFESYLQRRLILTSQTFTNVDQFTVVESLINTAQAATNGNIGIIVPTTLSGVLITKTYNDYERKNLYQAILDLSKKDSGFDFHIEVAYDGGYQPTKTLVLAYPRGGTAYSSSSSKVPVFEFPAGNESKYEHTEDGAYAANQIHGIGAHSGPAQVNAVVSDSAKWTAGWPLLQEVANYMDYTDASTVSALIQGQLNAVSYPPVTLTLVVPPSIDPVFGSYRLGDDCRVRIRDARFPTGLDAVYRISAITLSPGENGPETATLTMTLPLSPVVAG